MTAIENHVAIEGQQSVQIVGSLKLHITLDWQGWNVDNRERWEGHSRLFPLPASAAAAAQSASHWILNTLHTGPGRAQTKGRQQGHICLNPLQFVAGNWRGWQFGSFYASLTHAVVSGGDKWQNWGNIEADSFQPIFSTWGMEGWSVGERRRESISGRQKVIPINLQCTQVVPGVLFILFI